MKKIKVYQIISNEYNIIKDIPNDIAYFINKNFKYYIILMIAFILSNFLIVVDFSTGLMDSFAIIDYINISINESRVGNVIINSIFPNLTYPGIDRVIIITTLPIAVFLLINNKYLSNFDKCIFSISVLSFPIFTFLTYYSFQASFHYLGLLLIAIGYNILKLYKSILLLICAVILMFIGISSYQIMVTIIFTVIMIDSIIYYINGEKLNNIIKFILYMLFFIILALALVIITPKLFEIFPKEYTAGHKEYLKWGTKTLIDIYIASKVLFKDFLFGIHGISFLNTMKFATISILISLLFYIWLFRSDIKRISVIVLLYIGLFIATFSMVIIMGNPWMMVRGRTILSLSFLFGFGLMLIGMYKYQIFKYIAVIITLYCFIYNSGINNRNYSGKLIQYQNNTIIAQRIIDEIHNIDDNITKNTNVYIIGHIPLSYMTEIQKNSNFIFARSPFYFNKHAEMLYILQFYGLSNKYILGRDKNIINNYNLIINDMPQYPYKGFTKKVDNNIIIKLSEP